MPYTENWDGLNSSWGKIFIDSIFWSFLCSLCFDKAFIQWFPCMNSILLIFILRTEEIVGYGFCLGTIQLTNLEQRETKIKLSSFKIIWLDSPWDAVPYLFCKGSYPKLTVLECINLFLDHRILTEMELWILTEICTPKMFFLMKKATSFSLTLVHGKKQITFQMRQQWITFTVLQVMIFW